MVVIGFNALMERLQARWSLADLYSQARYVVAGIEGQIHDALDTNNLASLKRTYKRMSRNEHLLGLVLCSPKGAIISKTGRDLPQRCEM